MKKIFIMISSGIFFLICFGLLSTVVFSTEILTNFIGVYIVLYFSSFMEVAVIIVVLRLFSNIKSEILDSYRWITVVGSNKNYVN
jgi:hypothetical protein